MDQVGVVPGLSIAVVIGEDAVLTAGYGTLWPILIAAAVGAVLALPVSWAVAREIS